MGEFASGVFEQVVLLLVFAAVLVPTGAKTSNLLSSGREHSLRTPTESEALHTHFSKPFVNSTQTGVLQANLASANKKQAWQLRVCNAYAFETGVHIFFKARRLPSPWVKRATEIRLTDDPSVLTYKKCRDFGELPDLGVGSQFTFKLGRQLHMNIGTFVVTMLPAHASLLQLVVFRRDDRNTAAGFISHAFGNQPNPEVALVDAYHGPSSSGMEVRALSTGNSQELHFGTAVMLAPGWYEWQLTGDHAASFHGGKGIGYKLLEGGRYSAIRVGTEASQGPSFHEELWIYPTPGWEMFRSATAPCAGKVLLFLLTACQLLFGRLGA
mmetsp:Transcript_100423/g.199317  ORF Transcript_100423/g.199317 Transcript_100423/m.199317 type:complete len:326 (+) Transcript_100423:121-1098(+)